uniref:Ankyrin repeat and SOCS box containing 5b n=1 Tax=Sinocyclocheilus grahami TaxID=75366 RepID=A0A672N978_SINGR
MTEILEERPFGWQYTNVYLSIFVLFCFKLFVKISLNILTHFYVVKGNRKESARIAAEFYDFGQAICFGARKTLCFLAFCIIEDYAQTDLFVQIVLFKYSWMWQVNATTIDGVTPLFNACSAGSVTCTEVLLEHGAKPQAEAFQPSPIHEASSKGQAACIESLISWGADVDFDIPHLGTPIYIACVSRELQCTQKLLDGGANVQKGRFLDTPLHAAAQKDCPEIIRVLLDFGANINARNLELQRPVETAPPNSTAEAVLLLYEATPPSLCQLCRLSIRNYMGRSRLHLISHLKLPTLLKSFLQYR